MRRTGKIFLGIVLVVVLLVAGLIFFLGANLDSIVARLIEVKGSEATRTDVSVGAVELDVRGGTGRIANLSVDNPQGFSDGPAISFGEFSIRMDPMAVTEDPIVIREISVDGAEILLEQTTDGNNLRTLQEALGRQATEEEPGAEGAQVIIERFALEEARVQVRVPQLDESREITIPQVVVSDIGRASNGATAAEVARQILEPVIRSALESGAAAGVEGAVRDKVDETRERITEGLRDRLDSSNDSEQN
jgi:uncharacterized protein involved in outer membrane biogenesis